ncbi:MAG: outer membrane protein transport protein [Acidiferrobacterales bacterium]|nr:outer membrane protein transport protein [Acidiferrobacterales bacterium]
MIKLKTISKILIAGGLIVSANHSYAAGFQLSEVSVSGLGRAFAGAGVAADDVSDMFANPAGMSLLEGRQMQLGLSVVDSEASFEGSGVPFGGVNDDGGETGLVPNLFYVAPISSSLTYGFGLTAPFGLATEYEANWAGRYSALRSELKTIDLSPAISYKVSPTVALGASLSFQYADTELSQARFLGLGVPDGKSTVSGDNWGFGFNLGAVFTPTDTVRIGVGYRSEVDQDVEGDLEVVGPTGATLASAGAEASVTLPETFYISGAFTASEKIDVLASIRWTGWSSFEELRIKFDNGLPDAVTPENWEDTTTVSIGLAYHVSDQLTLRGGYAFDESPVSDEFRTARIPDADRDWFTLGASYSPSSNLTLDFAYARLEGDEAPISETAVVAGPPTSPQIVTSSFAGNYNGGANIFGIQAQFKF